MMMMMMMMIYTVRVLLVMIWPSAKHVADYAQEDSPEG